MAIISKHLVISNVPYVNDEGEVAFGSLVSTLMLSGDVTQQPSDHVAFFSGGIPCDSNGQRLTKLVIGEDTQILADGITIHATMSTKPVAPAVYVDYYDKMTNYIRAISSFAQLLDPSVTAQTFRVIEDEEDGVFEYLETQSSRQGIQALSERLELPAVAIVGVGGTGSYILDFLAKTPIETIHLYDADEFLQHNAFRSPGAPTRDQLAAKPLKVDYLAQVYSAMRRNIVAHGYSLDEAHMDELTTMDFVFIAIDDANAKGPIIDHLEAHGIPFVDVGMGLSAVDGKLVGAVRTTLSRGGPETRAAARARIATTGGGDGGEYGTNIQIAELNALNAAHAVIQFKKFFEFFADLDAGDSSVYGLTTNVIINDVNAA